MSKSKKQIGKQNKVVKSSEKNISILNKKTPKWFYLVLILIPIVFLILLEISLRLFNYGIINDQWLPVNQNKYTLNPDIAYRYFYTTKGIPNSNRNVFDIVKKPDAFRIFVFGGSSAAGYPYLPNGSFSVYIQKRLELLYPAIPIEVVNLSMSAVSSYTLRDLLPGALSQKPDLILIYAGHNEYYGALGAGSLESLGSSRTIVNFLLWLNQFKTVELVRNIVKSAAGILSGSKQNGTGGTLMARMAKDQLIEYNSETYRNGINQFEGNLRDMMEMSGAAGVPVLIGTLTSNLKDQPPFISVKTEIFQSAGEVYDNAKKELSSGNKKKADSLFRFAKDLDALRFRAPEEINLIIKKLANEYNYPIVDLDSSFNDASPDGIIGNNFMTDHLHPTFEGYQFMGKLYFDEMQKHKFLPQITAIPIPENEQDSLTKLRFSFSHLDSTIGKFRIAYLKNDWPFTDKTKKKSFEQIINLKDYADTLAIQVIEGVTQWEKSHRDMAVWYLKNKRFKEFSYEVKVLTDQFPFIKEYYNYSINELLKFKQYDLALEHLYSSYKITPNEFNTKWIGIINLSKNKTDEALRFLEKSLTYYDRDPQVFYNIAGAYSLKKENRKALNAIEKCLSLSPDFPAAEQLQIQLSSSVLN